MDPPPPPAVAGRSVRLDNGAFVIDFPYDAEVVAALRDVPGRWWDPAGKRNLVRTHHAACAGLQSFLDAHPGFTVTGEARAVLDETLAAGAPVIDRTVKLVGETVQITVEYDKEAIKRVRSTGALWNRDAMRWDLPLGSEIRPGLREFLASAEDFAIDEELIARVSAATPQTQTAPTPAPTPAPAPARAPDPPDPTPRPPTPYQQPDPESAADVIVSAYPAEVGALVDANPLDLLEKTLRKLGSLTFSHYRHMRFNDPDAEFERWLGQQRSLSLGDRLRIVRDTTKLTGSDAIVDLDGQAPFPAVIRLEAALKRVRNTYSSAMLDHYPLAAEVKAALGETVNRQHVRLKWTKAIDVLVQIRNLQSHPENWPMGHRNYEKVVTPLVREAVLEALTHEPVHRCFAEHHAAALTDDPYTPLHGKPHHPLSVDIGGRWRRVVIGMDEPITHYFGATRWEHALDHAQPLELDDYLAPRFVVKGTRLPASGASLQLHCLYYELTKVPRSLGV